MGIKEKDLQTLENLSDGDKLRVVTEEGNSRNIPANVVGGGGICIETEFINAGAYDKYCKSTEVTWEEAVTAVKSGVSVVAHIPANDGGYCNEAWIKIGSFVPDDNYYDQLTMDTQNTNNNFTEIVESDDHMVKFVIYVD